MSSDHSDIEIQSALSKKKTKMPKSPSDEVLANNNKKSTKTMIREALTELKTRKGVSTYAIKKYIAEKYKVNAEKINYLINKQIKNGVEDGSIVQMKGVGATGSFKLAPVKDKPKKPKKPAKPKEKKKIATEKDKAQMEKKKSMAKPAKPKNMTEKPKPPQKKVKEVANEQKKKVKAVQTPAKKRAMMMKRKSIGSIIKPPKMKPKAKA